MQRPILDYVTDSTKTYLDQMPKSDRKKIGQFFTPENAALFMADMFDIPQKEELHILDPGAGTGILTAALIQGLQEHPYIKKVCIDIYENDPSVLPILKANMDIISSMSSAELYIRIFNENYILSQRKALWQYDMIISNPPYKKIRKDAPEAVCMKEVCYGAPNLYFLFAAKSLSMLAKEGQMVYIIPRSWTSGAYFARFRKYLFKNGSLDKAHLFSNREVFNDQVLQETVIIRVTKQAQQGQVMVTCSRDMEFHDVTILNVPYDDIVLDSDKSILLPINDDDLACIKTLHSLKHTLPDIGFTMKTGLTVGFRNKQYISDDKKDGYVPLFYPRHIKGGMVRFPDGNGQEYISTDKKSLLHKNSNYLFIKRFTSKEENRRLQCGIYLAEQFPGYEYISTDNKLDVICADRPLAKEEVYGLYVLFNSTLYDRYYRILNGSTQVNASEINKMPVPAKGQIVNLGTKLIQQDDLSVEICDTLLKEIIL